MSENTSSAIAIWSEDVVLDPGNIRYPIRVVMVDNNFQTCFDRLVQLPVGSSTYIYRVLDHGIPWQHLVNGLALEDVKQHIVSHAKGKRLVMYDAWKIIGLFSFTEQQLSRFKIVDLKNSDTSTQLNGQSTSFWDLVKKELNESYTGKPGNYDTIELTDYVMRIYLQRLEKDEVSLTSPLNETTS